VKGKEPRFQFQTSDLIAKSNLMVQEANKMPIALLRLSDIVDSFHDQKSKFGRGAEIILTLLRCQNKIK